MPRRPAIKKLDEYGIVDTGTSDPSGAEQGQLFYNTADSALKVYINGSWISISGGGVDGTFDYMNGSDIEFMNGNAMAFMSG